MSCLSSCELFGAKVNPLTWRRLLRFDEKRQISRLIDAFVTKSNATQRHGRAGVSSLASAIISSLGLDMLPWQITPAGDASLIAARFMS